MLDYSELLLLWKISHNLIDEFLNYHKFLDLTSLISTSDRCCTILDQLLFHVAFVSDIVKNRISYNNNEYTTTNSNIYNNNNIKNDIFFSIYIDSAF